MQADPLLSKVHLYSYSERLAKWCGSRAKTVCNLTLWAVEAGCLLNLGMRVVFLNSCQKKCTSWIAHKPSWHSEDEEFSSCSCLVARNWQMYWTLGQRMWNLWKCEDQSFINIVTSVVMARCTLETDFAGLFQGSIFMVIVDTPSKCSEVVTMSTTTEKTLDVLHCMFARYGLPNLSLIINHNSFIGVWKVHVTKWNQAY